ncbi:MAG: repeat-like domain, partial [Gaiellaceae bacterium]|nr:repeat-like domain [Gaiellaceae bacterium]
DHVYAMWSVFDGNSVKIHESISRDRGQTFTAPTQISVRSQTGPATTYVYPSVDAAGNLYVALASFASASGSVDADIYVTRSTDDGETFSPWVKVAHSTGNPGDFVNGNFRDGILESFAASQTYPGHLYVTYEQWDGTQMDVKLSESIDGGFVWRDRGIVNDATNSATTDQFQPSVAAGVGGAVGVAFYDRRGTCPADQSVAAGNAGAGNTCADVTLQAYRETGMGTYSTPAGSNARMTLNAFDPSQPVQHVDGLGQQACSAHRDPCTEVFLGDYFGLAVSAGNFYGLFVSTHYPSNVKADEGGRVYYQQQVLATVPRAQLGL